jgi:SsrA-binding protein
MNIISKNKKAYFDYEILSEYTAGIVLTGPEIKSIRAGHVNLKGAYVSVLKGQVFLKHAHISRYSKDANASSYDPFRERRLLLNKAEIEKIELQFKTKGVTAVPLVIGIEGAYAKVIIGLARGRKKHDKRQVIKARTEERSIARAMRQYK